MNSVILLLVGIAMFAFGYLIYSKFIAEKIYRLDPDFETPAHELEDGVDFVPTNKYVLWGHHFTSVAGAAPIVGPAIAVIWGWLPAFLWVTIGTVFFAGVHDFGALWASVRNKGKSMGALTENYIGANARSLFMVVMFMVLLMVNAAFAVVIAGLLIKFPTAVIPFWGAIPVAIGIGRIIRSKLPLLWPSILGVAFLYGLILIGANFPISLPETVMGLSAETVWILLLFLYAGIASVLPVWVLLQPRDYINGLQLFLALGLLYAGTLIAAPDVVAPAWNSNAPDDAPWVLPLLFVTIACGAVSGFHGLVAGGTTSKQLNKETDARFVGYFGAVGEGMLALAAIICCTAGFASLDAWSETYSNFGDGSVGAFVDGGANILAAGLGLPTELAATILTVTAALFAGTTMDTGLRLQRYVVQEAGDIMGIDVIANGRTVPTLIALAFCLAIVFGAGGMSIWPLFGTSNQLLAGLTLSIITVMLMRAGRATIFTMVPLVFLLTMSVFALFIQLGDFFTKGQYVLLVMDILILGAALMVILRAVQAMRSEGEAKTTPAE